jgi:hypothetical protein
MWRSYYGHKPLALFGELVELLRDQYHVPFWRACAGAYYAAQAAVVFQRGHDRGEYERALPDLKRYYSIVRRGSDAPFDRGSDAPFDVEKSAQLELEWWIVHRERDRREPGGLARAGRLTSRNLPLPPGSVGIACQGARHADSRFARRGWRRHRAGLGAHRRITRHFLGIPLNRGGATAMSVPPCPAAVHT